MTQSGHGPGPREPHSPVVNELLCGCSIPKNKGHVEDIALAAVGFKCGGNLSARQFEMLYFTAQESDRSDRTD